MPKPFLLVTTVLTVILMALAACTGATPAPETAPAATPTTAAPTTVVAPTDAPQPAEPAQTAVPPTTETPPTAASTATPAQPPAPEPTPASPPTSEGETRAGILSPLNLHETEDVDSELSEPELACLKEIRPVLHLRWAWTLTGSGNQEERINIIACLEDEFFVFQSTQKSTVFMGGRFGCDWGSIDATGCGN